MAGAVKRGSPATIFNGAVATTVQSVTAAFPCKAIQINVDGANPVRLFWTRADADANTNYAAEMAATTGYYQTPGDDCFIKQFFLRAQGGVSSAQVNGFAA